MRWIAIVALAACSKDQTAQFVELAVSQGPTVNAMAAWAPLLERNDGFIGRWLVMRARHELAELATPNPDSSDASPIAQLRRTINHAKLCVPLPVREDTSSYCRDAIAKLRAHLAALASDARGAGTPEDKILTLDKPDPATKQKVDQLLASVAPGPKAAAWNAAKADEAADPATFDAICAAAGDEWKARSSELFDAADFRTGFRECRETQTAARLLAEIAADKHCPDGMFASVDAADLIPKRYATKLAAEAKACADRYK